MPAPAEVPVDGREPRPGRRRGLTPAQIAEGGRRVIERDGLDALTMRAVAAEIGTAAPSLYRHVADRDALLLAILEDVLSGLPNEVAGPTPRARLHRRFVACHDYLSRHLWVVHVLVAGELVAESALPFTELGIADFRAAGLALQPSGDAYRACYQFMIGELLDIHTLTPGTHPTQRERAVAGVDPQKLPLIAELSAGGIAREDRFAPTLDAILTGLLGLAPAR